MENSKANNHRVSAVIFDLDGTLLNTEQVSKSIFKEFLARYGKVLDSEKEKKTFGLTFKDSVVMIVNDYDLPLTTEQFVQEILPMYHGKWVLAKALPGANRLMEHLHKHGVPFALASNAQRRNIDAKIAPHDGWKERFTVILGSDQVKAGKPSPDIFLEAAIGLGVDPLHCLVIEDSIVGVKAGKAAGMKVVAVPSLLVESDSYSIADVTLHSLLEFEPELWGLPQFEDWIDNALPIEPVHLSGVLSNGLFQAYGDDVMSALPDQVWGIYIGWAKFDGPRVLKTVISIGWSLGDGHPNRNIQACIIDGNDADEYDAKMQLVLVGYLRRSCSVGHTLDNLEILEDDKSSADVALNLPAFSLNRRKSFFLGDVEDDLATHVKNTTDVAS